MHADNAAVADVAAQLARTLSGDATVRREATTRLTAFERSPGFLLALLTIAGTSTGDAPTRQSAATLFKNVVKRLWADDDEGVTIAPAERALIRGHLVNLMTSVPPLVQRQLSEGLATISTADFPSAWPTLLVELVAKLGPAVATGDWATAAGVLDTAASVFERFRGPDTDETRTVLLKSVAEFAQPLTDAFKAVHARVGAGTAAGEGPAALGPPLGVLRAAVVVYGLLTVIDLPEYFEDALAEWMGYFHTSLTYSNPRLAVADDSAEEGPVEALQAAVLDVVALFASKYDADFEPFFSTFVSDVWSLLSAASATRIAAPHMDPLVTQALRFLTSAVGPAQHAPMFGAPGALAAMVERIVVPNVALRDADVELLDDNPVEFLRRDIEGSDSDTRRRCASDFLRGLCRHFNADVSARVSALVDALLADASGTVAERDVRKDAAIALFIALAVRAQTTAGGVTTVNELVSVPDFLRRHVLPELQVQGAAVRERPLAKAAALKFVATFRAQFSRDELGALLPLLVPFLASAPHYVVYTYAAAAVERLLLVRDRAPPAAPPAAGAPPPPPPPPPAPRLPADVLDAATPELLRALFARMAPAAAPGAAAGAPAAAGDENEYLMRATMRVVAAGRERVAPLAPQLVAGLTAVLARVCANPANPSFNHCLFETVAALMRFVAPARPEALPEFEAALFPPFQAVLVNDVAEFLPYVFQLLAELLELRPAPDVAAGASALTDAYRSLLPPLLNAALWARRANVPALAALLQAYLRKGGASVAGAGLLVPALGIFQRLLQTKGTGTGGGGGATPHDELAFDVLVAMTQGVPWDALRPHLSTVLQLLLTKLQDSKAARVARRFAHWAAVFAGTHGPAPLEAALAAIGGPALPYTIVENVLAPMANRVAGAEPRREAAVGLTRLLTGLPGFFDASGGGGGGDAAALAARGAAWGKLLVAVVELCEPQPAALAGAAPLPGADGGVDDDAALLAAGGDGGGGGGGGGGGAEYAAAYSRLVYAAGIGRDRHCFAAAGDARSHLARSLAALAVAAPGRLPPLVAATPVAAAVASMCAAAGVVLA